MAYQYWLNSTEMYMKRYCFNADIEHKSNTFTVQNFNGNNFYGKYTERNENILESNLMKNLFVP